MEEGSLREQRRRSTSRSPSPTPEVESASPQSTFSKDDYNHVYQRIGAIIHQWIPLIEQEKKDKTAFDTIDANPFLEDVDRGLEGLKAKHENKSFNVAVLALCKSGKSTFLNAMIGKDLLPSSNVPETACIVQVKHNPSTPKGILTDAVGCVLAQGKEITDQIRKINLEAREKNSPPAEICLQIPLVGLNEKTFAGCTSSFDISDTPGPNEAGTDSVRPQVELLMNTADVILYILDYSKLKTEEEASLLERLRGLRPDLVQDVHARLFIVVNKMDLVRKRHGLNFRETKEYVATTINQYIPKLKITPDRVLPVSAERALLSRQVLNGTASQSVRDDCCELMFGQDWDGKDLDEERLNSAVEKLLQKSGFVEMEERVLSFLFEHSASIFISCLVGDALRRLYIFNNYLQTTKGALERKSPQSIVNKLKNDLLLIHKQFENALQVFEQSTSWMEVWVEQQFCNFANEMQGYVDKLIDGEKEVFSVSLSAQEHKEILDGVNKRVSDGLTAKFIQFRKELELQAFHRQQDIFTELANKLQPFVNAVSQTVGKLLEIEKELIPAEFAFPTITVQSFRLNIDQSLSALLVAKLSLFRMLKGWCSKGGLVLGDDTQYYTNTTALKSKWHDKIQENSRESIKVAKLLVGERIRASMDHAKQELHNCIEGYTKTIESALAAAQKSEERCKERIARLNKLIEIEKDTISELLVLQQSTNRLATEVSESSKAS